MGLQLVVGPANSGKVALLLERYLGCVERQPVLIVPSRSDVDRVERELLAQCGCLLGGTIVTFESLFEWLSPGAVLGDAERSLLVRRVVGSAPLNGLARSAGSAGFPDTLASALGELAGALVDPAAIEGDLGALYGAYLGELARLGVRDRELRRRDAVERLRNDFDGWHGQPVFAYGFEDLTAAEWALLEALAARADVTVSLPYEPGRAVFSSLRRTSEDLAGLATRRIEELPPRYHELAPPPLAHLERTFATDTPGRAPELDGSLRFFEAAGTRGVLELVGAEILALVRAGTPAERIGVVCPAIERWRAPLESAFGALGVPYSIDARVRLAETEVGRPLLALVRFAWLGGRRRDLFVFLRSRYSSLQRANVDFVEGRLRGRGIQDPERVVAEMEALRGAPLPMLDALRGASDPIAAVRELAAFMVRAAYGTDAPPAGDQPRRDLAVHEELRRVLDELERWRASAGDVSREDVAAALERAAVRLWRGDEPARVAVVDLLRARTRRFDVVFLLGLEEGSLPRRGSASPLLDDDVRRDLGARLERPDSVARDRYLFYTACTRPSRRLYLVREAAGDEGTPREPSPFWDEVRALFDLDDVARWTTRRSLSQLTWPVEGAPTERERLRGLAA
ncbi:MAG TPA: hypothetical protein VJ814_08360, partial [Gaiellaceae bacterium]|nr:hypothetical protein [Gaiellaceae bacterium]